jgi:hypothetical protein
VAVVTGAVVVVVADVADVDVGVVEVGFGVVDVDVDEVVAGVDALTSVDACVCACCASTGAFADGRSLCIAWPRLIAPPVVVVEPVVVVVEPVVIGVEPLVVDVEPVVVDVEPVGLTDVPSIKLLRSLNGTFRFRETCSAAMNCP